MMSFLMFTTQIDNLSKRQAIHKKMRIFLDSNEKMSEMKACKKGIMTSMFLKRGEAEKKKQKGIR